MVGLIFNLQGVVLMSMRKLVQKSFEAAYAARAPHYRARLSAWNKGRPVTRMEGPLNPMRARALGYKAKKEFLVARVRVAKGKRRLAKRALGRKPKKKVKFRPLSFSLSRLAEMKAEKEFGNTKSLGAYYVGEDGMSKYYEVVLRNPHAGSAPNAKPQK
jgi:large subunit ribosomal protein L15e